LFKREVLSKMSFNVVKKIQEAGMIVSTLGVIGFIGIVWLMIYGNLSGNLGFTSGTTDYNNTQNVITNMTGGYNTFFEFSNTFFTIGAIVLLIFMLLGLLALVISIMSMVQKKNSGGFA
jgi:hypothetical protein